MTAGDSAALRPKQTAPLKFLENLEAGDDTLKEELKYYCRMGVVGDGSCFFHSLCAALDYKDYNSMTEKEQRDMILSFRCGFSKFYENDKKDFCTLTKWADKNLIQKVSKFLKINILFIDLEKDEPYCGVHGKETIKGIKKKQEFTEPTIVIMWVHKNTHFEPLVKIKNKQIQGLFNPSDPTDIEFIKAIVNFYITSC
jgi:hypothetical protein